MMKVALKNKQDACSIPLQSEYRKKKKTLGSMKMNDVVNLAKRTLLSVDFALLEALRADDGMMLLNKREVTSF